MSDDWAFLDALAQADLVRQGTVTPSELVDDAITRVEKLNPELNAVIHPRFDAARAEAAGALRHGPLRGVPIVIKDLDASTAGDPLHHGNQALKAAGRRAEASRSGASWATRATSSGSTTAPTASARPRSAWSGWPGPMTWWAAP